MCPSEALANQTAKASAGLMGRTDDDDRGEIGLSEKGWILRHGDGALFFFAHEDVRVAALRVDPGKQ